MGDEASTNLRRVNYRDRNLRFSHPLCRSNSLQPHSLGIVLRLGRGEHSMASADEALQFERDGCIRVRGFFDARTLADVRRQLDRYVREIAPALAEQERTFEADGVTIRNL